MRVILGVVMRVFPGVVMRVFPGVMYVDVSTKQCVYF